MKHCKKCGKDTTPYFARSLLAVYCPSCYLVSPPQANECEKCKKTAVIWRWMVNVDENKDKLFLLKHLNLCKECIIECIDAEVREGKDE